MLKVARIPDEGAGYRLLTWWDGQGAARVFASTADALLMERASGAGDLAQMAWSGRDDEACQILCDTAARLHAPRSGPLPDLHPLEDWFQPLFQLAPDHAALAPAADIARQLLAAPHAIGPLHGDLHHENVLDFGERDGWRSTRMGWSANEHSTMPTSSRTPTSAIRAGRLRPCRVDWRPGWISWSP